MSIKDLLWNQYRYPLPAPPPYFTHVHDTNSMIISVNSQYVNVTGIADPLAYGITNPNVQVSMISTGFQNSDLQMCGYSDYDPVAGTLDILVNNCSDATTRFLIFISQSTDV
jgi:hypothetical protein